MHTTDRSPFLDLPGAVEGQGVDAGTPAHYGSLLAEQRPLASGRAIVDQGHLAVLRVQGGDRLHWLDSLTSQSLRLLEPGAGAETLLLDANGRLEHAFAVIEDGESSWLVTEGTRAAALRSWLDRMRFLLDVRVSDESAGYGVIASLGTPDLPVAAPAGVPLRWDDPWSDPPLGGVTYATARPHPGSAWTLRLHLLERAELARLAARVRAGEIPVAGQNALEALRIAAWRPRIATEADERSIPHEFDWLRSAVHLDKGCYRGQETVAKVHNLGHPPRRLVALDLDGAAPEPGNRLRIAGEEDGPVVGVLTSVGQHHEEGPIALALVKRSLDPAAALTVRHEEREVAAAQRVIVPPDAGRSVELPKLDRAAGLRAAARSRPAR